MKGDELYINNRIIELSDLEPIAFTYQRNDIAELADRQADYSNEFFIPETNNNNIALNHANTVQSNTLAAYRRLPATFIRGGRQIITNGVAVIDSSQGGYRITLYSGIFDFFNQLGDQSLSDIDWSEFNHIYNVSTIIALNAGYLANTDDVCWPIINWGAYKNDQPVDVLYQQAAIRFSKVMEKIVAKTTYSVSGQIFGDGIYTDLALTLSPDEYAVDDSVLQSRSYDSTLTGQATDVHLVGQGGPSIANILHFFRTPATGFEATGSMVFDFNLTPIIPWPQGWSSAPNQVSNTRRVARAYETVEIKVKLFFEYISLLGNENVRVFKNNMLVATSQVGDYPASSGDFTNIEHDSTYTIELKPGDEIKIQLYARRFSIGATGDATKNRIQITSIDTIALYTELNFNALIPNYKLKDIIRSFCQMFALIPSTSNTANEITFTKFSEIKANIAQSENWTSKLDLTIAPNINYRIGNYAQNNWAKYATDEEVNGFGDASFSIDDLVLEKENNLFQLIYPGCLPEENIRTTNARFKPLPIEDYYTTDQWAGNLTPYAVNDEVGYAGIIFKCIQTIPGTFAIFIGTPTYWQVRSDQYDTTGPNEGIKITRYTLFEADDWDQDEEYTAGDEVTYSGKVWIALRDNENVIPSASTPVDWFLKTIQYEQTVTTPSRLILIRALSPEYTPVFTNVSFTDGVSTSSPLSLVVPIAYFSDSSQSYNISWQYLFQTYYLELQNMLKQLKVVSCLVNLTEKDIQELDFLKLKYFEQFGNHFYLNKVEDYQQGKSSMCQLIRM